MARRGFTILAFVAFLFGATGQAQIPHTLSYQGLLTDTLGTPLPDGSYNITFRLYQTSTGGSALWQEVRTLQTKRGVFFANLGEVTPLGLSFDRQYWLGVQISGNSELVPRMALTASGYSLHSQKADTASYAVTALSAPGQWTVNGSNISYTNGNVGIGTSNPAAELDVTSSGTTGVSASGVTDGVFGAGNTHGVYGSSSNGYGVFGSSNNGYGVVGTSFSNAGVLGSNTSGTGVSGISTNSYGVYASSTNGYGLYATGGPNGVVATANSGAGVSATSSGGPGVVALGNTNGLEATGGSRGVYATGTNYGVVGAGSTGMYGAATTGNPGYGVFGSNGGLSNADAGYFDGDVIVQGFLVVNGYIYKNGGGFRIDHPTDPANKYLYHSFVESPDMKNIYDGVVVMGSEGDATVTLPDWFGTLNKEFRYQLTAIGAPGPDLHIAEEISQNHFRIAGGTSGMKVSWQVTGIRKDAYAEAHRIPVEVLKTEKERGKYLSPKELGFSETLGMNYEVREKVAAERRQMEEQQTRMEQEHRLHEEQQIRMETERKNIEKQRAQMEQQRLLPEKQK